MLTPYEKVGLVVLISVGLIVAEAVAIVALLVLR